MRVVSVSYPGSYFSKFNLGCLGLSSPKYLFLGLEKVWLGSWHIASHLSSYRLDPSHWPPKFSLISMRGLLISTPFKKYFILTSPCLIFSSSSRASSDKIASFSSKKLSCSLEILLESLLFLFLWFCF